MKDPIQVYMLTCLFFGYRLLKMGRQLTLGIGDNREHCFYIPVGFRLLRQYIDNGFELEELASRFVQKLCDQVTNVTHPTGHQTAAILFRVWARHIFMRAV